jgi:hypothetical protein
MDGCSAAAAAAGSTLAIAALVDVPHHVPNAMK